LKMKKKIHVIWFALLAIFAFGAFSTTSAFATPEILSGEKIIGMGEDLHLELFSTLLFEDTGATPKLDIECNAIFDYLVELPGTLLTLNEMLMADKEEKLTASAEGILNLAGTEINTGDDVECLEKNNLCTGSVLVVALNFPWDVTLLLTEPPDVYHADFVEEPGKQPEYYMDCKFTELGGLLVEDKCDGLVEMVLENDPVTGDLLAAFQETGPKGVCALSGTASLILLSISDSQFTDKDDNLLVQISG
jgi:hypothetical protein